MTSDGSHLVGGSLDNRPYVWSADTGPVALADSLSGEALAVSSTGDVIVGKIGTGTRRVEAFLWSGPQGIQRLGDLDGGAFGSVAHAVSSEGRVVVGESISHGDVGSEAFVWTPDEGMIGLGFLPDHSFSRAFAVSGNGTVVVGESRPIGSDDSVSAFRWTKVGGMTDLGEGMPRDVNRDGSVIVGTRQQRATIWTKDDGTRDLQSVLETEFGLGRELHGWELTEATAISADGSTIVGIGKSPARSIDAWKAVIEVDRLVDRLLPGDANQDLQFDQHDLIQVQIAGKYLSGSPATWEEGDWDAAPGGFPGDPPGGNGLFDENDIIAALRAGVYLNGPYAATSLGAVNDTAEISILYDAKSGKEGFDTSTYGEMTSFNSSEPSINGALYSTADGPLNREQYRVELVPEPSSLILLLLASCGMRSRLRRRCARVSRPRT